MAVLRKENADSIVIYRLIKKMKTKIQSRKNDSNFDFSQAAQCLSEGMLGSA